ncbi:hypothetical protein [Tomitella fengzijianii]|uniref:Uncharacterized protein n=1 Tax=Tomitella fengzijianii TaxID=2597660 RepID=A0A516X712_9ACTN|nr:hypothetical protein [Tomitella fengzijianii]QDQ98451.1 hypothetical protein FO059_15400 [Tomitella fengzijianii]
MHRMFVGRELRTAQGPDRGRTPTKGHDMLAGLLIAAAALLAIGLGSGRGLDFGAREVRAKTENLR